MERNQKKLQNLFFQLRKNSSILRKFSVFFLLSIFSFLLTFNHEFYQIFFNQFNPFKKFLNKKIIFCFFNAILLFVAKDSGFLSFSMDQSMAAQLHCQDFAEKSQLWTTKKITMVKNSEILRKKKISVEEKKQSLVTEKKAVKEKEVEKMKPAALMEGSDEEVVGEMEELGIDELNKKFEEFIERMKKEIKMEALQEKNKNDVEISSDYRPPSQKRLAIK